MKALRDFWPDSAVLRAVLLGLFALTVTVGILAVALGFHRPPSHPPSAEHLELVEALGSEVPPYRTYFAKPNWSLYPLFVLLIAIVLRFTWQPFQDAWRQSVGSAPVVRRADGSAASEGDVDKIVQRMESARLKALVIGLVAAAIWSFVDTERTRTAYSAATYAEQLQAAWEDPDFSMKWLFESPPTDASRALPPPPTQVLFTLGLEVEQWLLIALGFLVLFQIGMQTFVFVALDSVSVGGESFRIHLDPHSALLDFGLGAWNRALDLTYWFIGLGLLIAVVSAASQPSDQQDAGQVMGKWALGVLLATPFVVTVFGRRRWMYECEERLRERPEQIADWDLFHKQHLWPMDPKRFDKVGIFIALILYAVFAGRDTVEFLKHLVP